MGWAGRVTCVGSKRVA